MLRSLPDSRDVLLDPRLANPDELLKVKPAVDAFEEAMVPILAEKDDVPVCTGAFYWVNRVNHHVENAKYSVRTAQNYYVTWDDFHWKYDLEKTVNRLEDLDSYLSMERYSLLYLEPIREVRVRAHSNQPRLSAALHFCVTPCYLHFPARFCHSSRPSWRPSLATSKAFTFGSGPSNTGLHLSAAAAASAPHRVSCSRALEWKRICDWAAAQMSAQSGGARRARSSRPFAFVPLLCYIGSSRRVLSHVCFGVLGY